MPTPSFDPYKDEIAAFAEDAQLPAPQLPYIGPGDAKWQHHEERYRQYLADNGLVDHRE